MLFEDPMEMTAATDVLSQYRDDSAVPLIWDFSLAIGFSLGFVAARFFLDKFVFHVLSLWLLGSNNSKKGKVSEAVQEKVMKLSESMWKFTYYGTLEASVLAAGYCEPWFWDVKEYLRGWPNQELRLPIRLIYMCQCGFYIYSIVALLTWETRRKDFSVMMSHHIITVFLIGHSYLTRFFRIGSVILALHDASDVFLEAAKVFKYLGNEVAASILFGLFAISWMVLRLIFFPFWVIRASSYYFIEHVPLAESYNTLRYYIFNTLLLSLLVFHIYWWVLIYSMIMRQLNNRGKVGEDIRSDSDDD